jgi:predicted nucleic acid-binding Zn ribbon protein
MNKKNLSSLGEAISEFLSSAGLDKKLAETKAIAAWSKLMGPAITKHTKEIYIRDKKLIIKLDSSVLREELSFGKEKIKNMLNDEVGSQVIEDVLIL